MVNFLPDRFPCRKGLHFQSPRNLPANIIANLFHCTCYYLAVHGKSPHEFCLRRRMRTLVTIICLFCSGLSSQKANALTIVQVLTESASSASSGSSTVSVGHTFIFDLFDPSLGTLTSVGIEVVSSGTLHLSEYNIFSVPQLWNFSGNVSSFFAVVDSTPPRSHNSDMVVGGTSPLIFNPLEIKTLSIDFELINSDLYHSELGFFYGTGTTRLLTSTLGDGNSTYAGKALSDTTIAKITYTYTVPDLPNTLTLICISGGLFIALQRRLRLIG